MKKTLTVNLGGTVFHIDEDAYRLLDKYLTNLRDHFGREKDSEEIISDFEMRISELFNERIRLGYGVISIEEVETVIKRMGKPEELFEEDKYKEEKEAAFQKEAAPGKKRLMRDPENRVFGGVAGGIAAYMNVDVTVVRLIMILLLFVPYVPFVIPYLILWLLMPLATTATEKLQMRGEKVTLENIGKTVTNGFDKFSGEAKNFIQSEKSRTFLQKLADLFVAVVGFCLKFFAILVGIILLPLLLLILFVLTITMIVLVVGGGSVLYHMSPFAGHWFADASLPLTIIGGIGTLLLIGIPVLSLAYVIFSQLFKFKPLPSATKWVLLLLWILSIGICVFYAVHTGMNALEYMDWSHAYSLLPHFRFHW